MNLTEFLDLIPEEAFPPMIENLNLLRQLRGIGPAGQSVYLGDYLSDVGAISEKKDIIKFAPTDRVIALDNEIYLTHLLESFGENVLTDIVSSLETKDIRGVAMIAKLLIDPDKKAHLKRAQEAVSTYEMRGIYKNNEGFCLPCQYQNDTDSGFCILCGRPFEKGFFTEVFHPLAYEYCGICFTRLLFDARYCKRCGERTHLHQGG